MAFAGGGATSAAPCKLAIFPILPTQAHFIMKRPIIFLSSLLMLAANGRGQPREAWIRYFEIDQNRNNFFDVFQTRDGGYICVGQGGNQSRALRFLIIRTDSEGRQIWNRCYYPFDAQSGSCELNSVIQTDDGGFAIAGPAQLDGVPRFYGAKLNANGETVWEQNYGEPRGASRTVIETKSGDLLFGGSTSGDLRSGLAMAILVAPDGAPIWDCRFGSEGVFNTVRAIREVEDDGYYLGCYDGSDGGGQRLTKINFNGEILWSQQYERSGSLNELISIPNSFVMTGHLRGEPLIRVVDRDGNQVWQRTYGRGEQYSQGFSLARLSDGGFLMVGQYNDAMAMILRTDPAGNLQWRSEVQGHYWYRSVVLDANGFPVIAGRAGSQALLRKLYSDRSPPVIIERFPADSLLRVLTGDTLLFWVHAVDYQGDRINYLWLRNDDEVSRDSSARIDFPERGEYRVECQVSDTLPGRPAHWAVEAHDLLIEAYEPDMHYLSIQRNSEIDFSLDSIAYIGERENLRYEWMIYDSATVRWEEVAGDDRIGIRSYAFDRTGGYSMKARVFDPNVDPVPADSVQWAIQVRGVIRAYEPNLPEISLEPRQEATFELIPFNANNDSIEFWWTLNEADTLSTQSTLSISFQDTGRYVVSGYARERVSEEEWEEDVQRWAVNVGMLSVDDFGLDSGFRRNDDPLNISIAPNPFNDHATVTVDLGGRAFLPALRADKNVRPPRAQVGGLMPVRIGLYAIDGREILRLHDGPLSPGSHTFALSHFGTFTLPSGIYFLRLQSGTKSLAVKAVMMR